MALVIYLSALMVPSSTTNTKLSRTWIKCQANDLLEPLEAPQKLQISISHQRLTRYLASTKGDLGQALRLYELNLRLGQLIYGALHGFEITLRKFHARSAYYLFKACRLVRQSFVHSSDNYQLKLSFEYTERERVDAKDAFRSKEITTSG